MGIRPESRVRRTEILTIPFKWSNTPRRTWIEFKKALVNPNGDWPESGLSKLSCLDICGVCWDSSEQQCVSDTKQTLHKDKLRYQS